MLLKNMDKEIFFSVVIPVYNKAPHIQRSITSVLSQRFSDFELLIIDDASTDGSLNEIKKFTDKRIRLFQRDMPGPGGYAARNLGISHAKGEWIAFLDADDEWMPDHLERMAALIAEFPEVNVLGCGWKTSRNSIIKTDRYYKNNQHKGNHLISLEAYLRHCIKSAKPINSIVACIRNNPSQLLPNLFPANSGAKRGGDLHAWLRLMCHFKLMAWSNHIGAIYYNDIVGQVVSTASPSTILLSKPVFTQLSKNLTKIEKKLLKDYLNILLRNTLITSIRLNLKRTDAIKHIYWKGNLWLVSIAVGFASLPRSILKMIIRLKIGSE